MFFHDYDLNGLINLNRGKREGVEAPVERRLTNNIIFMKLKIALNMQAEAVLEAMDLSGLKSANMNWVPYLESQKIANIAPVMIKFCETFWRVYKWRYAVKVRPFSSLQINVVVTF